MNKAISAVTYDLCTFFATCFIVIMIGTHYYITKNNHVKKTYLLVKSYFARQLNCIIYL